MNYNRAKEIIKSLADGIDPITGELLPVESVYNSPDVIRALFTILQTHCPEAKELDPLRNKGKPWTKIEDDKLKDEFYSKIDMTDIAKEHGRSYSAIESRLNFLGLKKKSFWFFKKRSY